MQDDPLLRLARALLAHGYRFTTPTPATHARVNARPANAWAQTVTDVFGWSRPFHAGILPEPIQALAHEAAILVADRDGWRATLRLSTLDDPALEGMAFLHSAYPTEAADSVFFGPDTYRFASAITAWLDRAPRVQRAVDIGCGAGPGACLIARARPDAEVLAVDINDAALRLTRINAALNGTAVAAHHSNLLTAVPGTFDLIVSNPPYLADPTERAYRHGGGPLGAALSLAIVDAAIPRLSPGGTLLLYTGAAIVGGTDPFHQAVTERLARHDVGWTYRELDPDVFGEELEQGPYQTADRIAAILLTAITRN